MRDMDELLRGDARRWQTRVPDPPDFTAALDTAVGAGAAGGRSWRLVLSVAATVVLVVGAVAFALNLGHRSSSHEPQLHGPAAIVVNGKRIPYVGVVPWAGPISYASDRSVVYVYADNDALTNVCGVEADRARVAETATTVSILVVGYSRPLPDGVACAGVGHAPVPVAVHLGQPLNGRTLVDAGDGTSHRVLDAATVPMPRSVPDSCVARPLTWNENRSLVTRNWGGTPPTACQLALVYGPRRVMNRDMPPTGLPGTATIGQSLAHTWRYKVSGTRGITFEWSPRPGFVLQLSIAADAPHQFTYEQELAIARSVH
jgi:hypothetical protein